MLVREYKLSQLKVAKLLGMKQPAVNYVITGRRRVRYIDLVERVPELRSILDNIARSIHSGTSFNPCELCEKISKNSELLGLVLNYFGERISATCFHISSL